MIFKSITFILMIFIFNACSPVYKVVYDYKPPKNKYIQKKLSKCYQDKKICLQRCNQNFLSCKEKAKIEANKEYEKKLEEYNEKLSSYNYHMRKRDDLQERFSYYNDICNSKNDKYACTKAQNYKTELNNLKYLYRPIKPDKYEIFQNIINTSCQSSCGCEELFRSCYISAGGTVTSHKVCIRNCD